MKDNLTKKCAGSGIQKNHRIPYPDQQSFAPYGSAVSATLEYKQRQGRKNVNFEKKMKRKHTWGSETKRKNCSFVFFF
jgi:hypothetical protein